MWTPSGVVAGRRFLLAGGLVVLGRVPTEAGGREARGGDAEKPEKGARRKEVLGGGLFDVGP